MIQPRDQVELAVGQIRRHESKMGVTLCLMLGPSATMWRKWDICVMLAEGRCKAYVALGVCDHPVSWLLEETEVVA